MGYKKLIEHSVYTFSIKKDCNWSFPGIKSYNLNILSTTVPQEENQMMALLVEKYECVSDMHDCAVV